MFGRAPTQVKRLSDRPVRGTDDARLLPTPATPRITGIQRYQRSNDMNLESQIAVVTGASRGIGRAIAVAFAKAGADVVATARTLGGLAGVADDIAAAGRAALPVAADLAEADAAGRIVAAAQERFGRIDILVNNAGNIHPYTELTEFDPDDWRQVIEVNLVAPAMLIRAVLPHMADRKSGTIINISSIGGRRGGRGRTAYRATKAGLISLTESVAAEARPHGINVNCICPGAVDTEGLRDLTKSRGRTEPPNLMSPSEIADIALFLASPNARAITGTAIDAFGGTNPLFGSG